MVCLQTREQLGMMLSRKPPVDGCESIFLAFYRVGFDILSYPSRLGLVSQGSLIALAITSKEN